MSQFLDALVEPRLYALDEQVEQSKDYRDQTEQRDACIKSWLEKVGADKRFFPEMLLILTHKNQELIEKDVFMRGFTLGALTTMEAHINQEKYIGLGKDRPKPPPGFLEKRDPWERPYIQLITQELVEERVKAITLHPDDARFLELEAGWEDYLKNAAAQTNVEEDDAAELEEQLLPIGVQMLRLKNKQRFSYGYSLGMFFVGDVFDFRDKLLAKEPCGAPAQGGGVDTI